MRQLVAPGRWRLPLLAAVVVAGLGWQPAAGQSDPATAAPATESWYQVSPTGGGADPVCGALTCPPIVPPASPFPEDTLHVGVAAGRDTAYTFVALDAASLPSASAVVGGTLRVPVLADPAVGSLMPEVAQLVACAATGPVERARGGAPSPSFDCLAASAPGRFDGAAESPTFTFDLRFLGDAVRGAGIAIVPSSSARINRDNFRVVIPAAEHPSEARIELTLELTEAAAEPADGSVPPPPSPPAPLSPSPTPAIPPVATGTLGGIVPRTPVPAARVPAPSAPSSFGTGLATPSAAAAAAAPVSPTPSATTPIVAVDFYAYPGAWLAPFAIVGIAVLLSRSLSEPIELSVDRPTRSGS